MVPLNPTFFMRVQTLFAVPLGTRPQLAEIAVTNNAKKKTRPYHRRLASLRLLLCSAGTSSWGFQKKIIRVHCTSLAQRRFLTALSLPHSHQDAALD